MKNILIIFIIIGSSLLVFFSVSTFFPVNKYYWDLIGGDKYYCSKEEFEQNINNVKYHKSSKYNWKAGTITGSLTLVVLSGAFLLLFSKQESSKAVEKNRDIKMKHLTGDNPLEAKAKEGIYCSKCNMLLSSNDSFCPRCGTPVKSENPL